MINKFKGLALLHFAKKGDNSIVSSLLEDGVDPNFQDKYGSTALHRAVGWSDTVSLLLKAGTDPRIKNSKGKTPFDVADDRGYIEDAWTLSHAVEYINKSEKDIAFSNWKSECKKRIRYPL